MSKFFCDNPDCPRRVFTERLSGIAAPGSRKTERLEQRLQKIALALGGAAGGRLARHLNLKVCDSTLLNASNGPVEGQNNQLKMLKQAMCNFL